MDAVAQLDLMQWTAEAGLTAEQVPELLEGFCRRATVAGLPLGRVVVGFDTLHPVVEGSTFHWQHADLGARREDYTRNDPNSDWDAWLRSPFHRLMESTDDRLRRTLGEGYEPGEFPLLDELRVQGASDYVAYLSRFGEAARLGEMDCIYSSWTTHRAGGFTGDDLAALDRLVPALAIAVKSVAAAHATEGVMATYLGRDAGRRVLSGEIERGVAEKIPAVLWFSDLEGFTRFADTAPYDQLLPFLNDYMDALASSVHDHGGEVLKFMGDGLLAIFRGEDLAPACKRAIEAVRAAQDRIERLNEARAGRDLPVTGFRLGLHVGQVFYGNIGSVDRLDFTVVGPAVNEVSRIESMCRSLEQRVIVSAAFAEAAGHSRRDLLSLGRYALRGVRRPQELFTLDPDAAS